MRQGLLLGTWNTNLRIITVKASNFGTHGNFGPFLARSVAYLGEFCAKKMNRTNFANRKFVYNCDCIHFSVGRGFDNSKPF
jgi:hypothetical protein